MRSGIPKFHFREDLLVCNGTLTSVSVIRCLFLSAPHICARSTKSCSNKVSTLACFKDVLCFSSSHSMS